MTNATNNLKVFTEEDFTSNATFTMTAKEAMAAIEATAGMQFKFQTEIETVITDENDNFTKAIIRIFDHEVPNGKSFNNYSYTEHFNADGSFKNITFKWGVCGQYILTINIIPEEVKTKTAKKNYSLNPVIDEDSPVKFNHVNIIIEDDVMKIDGLFNCQKLITAYNRFKKIMAQAASEVSELDGWGDWLPAKALTLDAKCWLNEDGVSIMQNGIENWAPDCLNVDINEDNIYIWGTFYMTYEAYKKAYPEEVFDQFETVAAVGITPETDGSEEDDDDEVSVFSLLPKVEDLNDDELGFEMMLILHQQEQIAKGNYTKKIGNAVVTFTNHEVAKIEENGWSYQNKNGKKMHFLYGRLTNRKNFCDFILKAYAEEIQREHQALIAAAVETDGSEDDDDEVETFNVMPAEEIDSDDELIDEPEEVKLMTKKITISVTTDLNAVTVDEFKEINAELDEITEGKNYRCDAEKGICATVDVNSHAAESVVNLFDEYGLNYRRFIFTENESETVIEADDSKDDFDAQLAKLEAAKAEAQAKEDAAKAVYKAAADETEKHRAEIRNFLNEHAKRLRTKLQSINLSQKIRLFTTRGTTVSCYDFEDVYIDAPNSFGKRFIITYYNGRLLAHYDTPAQVETVINRLKAAVERGKQDFTFPTKDELNAPPELELIDARMREIVAERDEFFTALEEAEANEEISQEHIDYLKSELKRLADEYNELWKREYALKKKEGVA